MKLPGQPQQIDLALFENQSQTISHKEIETLINKLEWFVDEYPMCTMIINLLIAVEQFLAATTPEKGFAETRSKSRSTLLFEIVLDNISNELEIADKEGDFYADDEEEEQFLQSAVNFCYKVVLIRLIELKNSNDIFYSDYWPKSYLKQQITHRSQAEEGA